MRRGLGGVGAVLFSAEAKKQTRKKSIGRTPRVASSSKGSMPLRTKGKGNGAGRGTGRLACQRKKARMEGMNFWRKQGKAILVGGGFLGLVVVGLAFLAASFLADLATKIPPTARPALHPARLGLFCEDVELRAKDGKKISGWWMPRGQKGNPPVIVLHGLGAGKAHMIDYILFAQAAGYPVLAIDFRGHGMSEASLTSIGYY